MTIDFQSKLDLPQVGFNDFVRLEDRRLLTQGGIYVADLEFEDLFHVYFVRSYVANGIIKNIGIENAKLSEGVIAVITSKDIDLKPILPARIVDQAMVRELLPSLRVRYVGEPIAVVIAKSKSQAAAAAELIDIEIEYMDPIIDPIESLGTKNLLFEGAKSNIASQNISEDFDETKFFSDCEVVVEERYIIPKVAPCPLEGRAILVKPSSEELRIYISTQAPHGVKDTVTKILGVKEDFIRVIAGDVGGGFGAKISVYPEEILVAYLSYKLNRTLKWVEGRSESMMALGHGRGQIQTAKLGGTRDGKFTHYSLEVIQDCGAYPLTAAFLPIFTRYMTSGTYDIANVNYQSKSVITNTNPVVAYRGAGRPEAAYAIERIVDKFARSINMDKVELRCRNFVRPDQFPYQTKYGAVYDSGDYETCLRRLTDLADLPQLREQKTATNGSSNNMRMGIGISSYVEITHGVPATEYGAAELIKEGQLIVKCGTFSHGQGHHTAFAQIAKQVTGMDLDDIDVVQGDTKVIPFGVGTFGSRSIQSAGVAINSACLNLIDLIKQFLSEYTNCPIDQVEFKKLDGLFSCSNRIYSYKEIAKLADHAGVRLLSEVEYKAEGPTYPFGSHIAVVSVNLDTCKVELLKIVTLDDAGKIINPVLAMGQLHGGVAQGAGEALFEEVIYDEQGNLLTSTLYDYGFPSATELPSFDVNLMETPTNVNDLGAKGIGESGTIGVIPAIANAVADALEEFPNLSIDIPTTPVKLFKLLYEGEMAPMKFRSYGK